MRTHEGSRPDQLQQQPHNNVSFNMENDAGFFALVIIKENHLPPVIIVEPVSDYISSKHTHFHLD